MRGFWACLCAILACSYSYAQQPIMGRSLADVIPDIENQYGITFSFNDHLLDHKKVSIDLVNLSVWELIAALELQSGLRFEVINDRYIIIRSFSNSDLVNVCGYVIDEKNKPLRGAAIRVPDRNQLIVSLKSGFFKIDSISYESQLIIEHLGFKRRLYKASDLLGTDCLRIQLKEKASVLPDIVITDYMATGIVKEEQSIIISPKEFKVLPGLTEPDILQTIQLSPGVGSPFETASGIFIRGGSPDLNLIRWNGIKTYSQSHFFGMLSSFNPYIAQEVTFTKEGVSAQYGDRVSGVIDIKSGEDIPDRTRGGAGVNMISTDAFVEMPLIKNRLSVELSGRRSYNDVIQTPTYNRLSDRVFQNTKISEGLNSNNQQAQNNFFFHDITGKVLFQPNSRDKFMISTLSSRDHLDFSSANQETLFNDVLNTANEGYNMNWQHQHQNTWWDTDFHYSRYSLDYEFRTTEGDLTETSSKTNFIRDYGASIDFGIRFSDHNKLLMGYQYSHTAVKYAFQDQTPSLTIFLDQANLNLNTHSLFAEYNYQTERTSLVVGLRANRYQELEDHYLEPRVSFRQSITHSLDLKATAEYRSQAVSQIKESIVSDLSLENQLWTLSSPDGFPVITSYQFTTGFSYNRKSWWIDVDAYLKNLEGITSLTFGFLNPIDNQFRNGRSEIKGIDIFVKKQFQTYKTWLSYSYLFSENQFSAFNNNRPFPGNWNIEHTIKWSNFYDIGHLHLSLGWLWHTGKAFTQVSEQTSGRVSGLTSGTGPIVVDFDGINRANLPLYHRLDFSAMYEFKNKKNKQLRYRLGLSILNLYNRKNLLNREFRTTPSLNNELIDTRVYALIFTPNAVFRIFW